MFLIVVDTHSKWPEVMEMSATTATHTIVELRKLFAAYELPKQLVSDNGPQFIADEFASFCKLNGVKHIRCAPYHPSSNGQAERFVQTFKRAMRTADQHTPRSQRLSSFLMQYRCTPHSTTNRPPCELFMGRRMRTQLDLLHPSEQERVQDSQARQKLAHDRHRANGKLWTRHIDHLRKYYGPVPESAPDKDSNQDDGLSFPVAETEVTPADCPTDSPLQEQPRVET